MRARPQRGGAAGREHVGAAGDHVAVVESDADAAAAVGEQLASPGGPRARRSRGSSAATALSCRTSRRPVAAPPACTIRRVEWPPSSPSARRPFVVGVEADAQPRRGPSPPSGASSHMTRAADSRTASRPAIDRVAQVQLGAVLAPRARPPARPAPTSSRTRPAAWPRQASRDAPLAGRAQRRVQAGRARAHHGDLIGKNPHLSRYGIPMAVRARVARASLLAAPRHGRASRAARHGWSRSSASYRRATGSGSTGSPRSRWTASVLAAVHPSRLRRLDRAGVRAWRWLPGCRHRGQPATPSRPRCMPRAARSQMVDLLLDRRRAVRVQRAPAARPSRPDGTRDGLLPVQQHRGRGPARARCGRSRARDDPRLGRASRQRDQRHLPRDRIEVLFVSIHQSPLYPGTGSRDRRRVGSPGGGSP